MSFYQMIPIPCKDLDLDITLSIDFIAFIWLIFSDFSFTF